MIAHFGGQFRWLSNFWPAPVVLDGVQYPTVEHAYQAAKTLDDGSRDRIRQAETPGHAKKLGKTVPIRRDWDGLKLGVMEDLVRQKFQEPGLRSRLLATGDHTLIEGNYWNDTFWGVCRGKGENHLGKILMKVRLEVGNGAP